MDNEHLKVGDTLLCTYGCRIADRVSTGNTYTVSKVENWGGFHVINDEEREIFPISSNFKRISEKEENHQYR